MFDIRRLSVREIPNYPPNPNLCGVIDAVELYETVCPVSKETGLRESALSILTKVLSPKDRMIADQILQYLPTIQEQPGISDSDAVDLMVRRLNSGSSYEDDMMRDKLMSVMDVLSYRPDVSESKIDFSSTEEPKED